MLNLNNKILTKLISLILAQAFLFTGVVYPESTTNKSTSSIYIQAKDLRVPMGFSEEGREKIYNRFIDVAKKSEVENPGLLRKLRNIRNLFMMIGALTIAAEGQTLAQQILTPEKGITIVETKLGIDSLQKELRAAEDELRMMKNKNGLSITPYDIGIGKPGISLAYNTGEKYKFGLAGKSVGLKLADVEAKAGIENLGLAGSVRYIGKSSIYAPSLEGSLNMKLQYADKVMQITAGHMLLPNMADAYNRKYFSTLSYLDYYAHAGDAFSEGWNGDLRLTLAGEIKPSAKKKGVIEKVNKLSGGRVVIDLGMLPLTGIDAKVGYVKGINRYLNVGAQNIVRFGIESFLRNKISLFGNNIGPISLVSLGLEMRTNVLLIGSRQLYPVSEMFIPFEIRANLFGGNLSIEGDYLPKTKSFTVEGKAQIGPVWGYVMRNPALLNGATIGIGVSFSLGSQNKTKAAVPKFYQFYNRGVEKKPILAADIGLTPDNEEWHMNRFDRFGNTIDEVMYNFKTKGWGFSELRELALKLEYLPHPEAGTYSAEEMWAEGGGICRDYAELLAKVMREGMGISTAQPLSLAGTVLIHSVVVAVGEKGYGKTGYIIVTNYDNIYFTDVKYEGFGSYARALSLVYPNMLVSSGGFSFTGTILSDLMKEPIFTNLDNDYSNNREEYNLARKIENLKNEILKLGKQQDQAYNMPATEQQYQSAITDLHRFLGYETIGVKLSLKELLYQLGLRVSGDPRFLEPGYTPEDKGLRMYKERWEIIREADPALEEAVKKGMADGQTQNIVVHDDPTQLKKDNPYYNKRAGEFNKMPNRQVRTDL